MEFISNVLLKDISYLWMIFFIMISAGLAKEYQLFAPAFAYVKNTFRSNRFVVVMLSAIGGILPIEGRVTVSAGLLDTVAPKEGHGREKLGIVDYLATHHYYLWSPLEKTVILPIAAFGISYVAWLGLIAPLLVVSLAFITWYIWTQIHEEEVAIQPGRFKLSAVLRNTVPMVVAIGAYVAGVSHVICFGSLALYYIVITQQWNFKKLLGYIRWDVLAWVGLAIALGNFMKTYGGAWNELLRTSMLDPHTFVGMVIISLIGFTASFLMGSSGKFVAIAVLMSQVFGVEYFLWFFAIDFTAYLLSPTHKCVMVGNRYFGTPLKTYYKALATWGGLLLLTAALLTFSGTANAGPYVGAEYDTTISEKGDKNSVAGLIGYKLTEGSFNLDLSYCYRENDDDINSNRLGAEGVYKFENKDSFGLRYYKTYSTVETDNIRVQFIHYM